MPTPPSFAHKPTLTGRLLTLRPARREDAADLLAVDSETIRLTGTHGQFTLAELEQWYATRAEHDDRIDWAIVENASGEWAGEAVLNDLDPQNRSCSFRILLQGPKFYGRGLGSEATELAVEHAFAAGVHRVELEVYEFNPRARRVYEKVGFRLEGTRRDALWWDGAWVDAHLMSRLATDQPAAANSVVTAGSVQGMDVHTERLVLHPVDRAEAQRIRDRKPDPNDAWVDDYPFDGDVTALTALLRNTEDGRDPRPFGYYQIAVDGRAVGGIGFFGPPEEGEVEIGYGLAPSARGHGYASEALRAMLSIASGLGVRSVRARTETDNVASRRTLERAGFTQQRVEGDTLHFATALAVSE